MSRYKPGLDDDRLVGQALRVLAEETERAQAPPGMEARLRAAFRKGPQEPAATEAPRTASAWKWLAAVGTAAGLAWLAFAAGRGPVETTPRAEAVRAAARTAPAAAEPARPAASVVAPPAASVVREAPRAVTPPARAAARHERATDPRVLRVAEDQARRAPRAPRPQPVIEHFEPLYPGDVLADLDAVHVVRLSVPRSALATLGWPSRPGQGGRDPVELDAMVGPDGMTRAVRFISQ
jgi:hypothetical protein